MFFPVSKAALRRRVARIWKRGGYFEKSEKCANDLDSNFHWSWISFRRFVRNLRRNVSAKLGNQSFLSAQCWVISKKKKKKKVFAKIQSDFSAEIRNSKVFSAQNWVIFQKKKKKVFTKIEAAISSNFANSDVWGGAVFEWGGYFPFFT